MRCEWYREVPALFDIRPDVAAGKIKCSAAAATHVTDFVWAVRLAKITKNGLQSDWRMETRTKGAVFSASQRPGPKVDYKGVVAAEGLDDVEVVEDAKLGCVFVFVAG